MNGRFRRWVALSTAGCVFVASSSAAAYGNNVHQRIVDLSWQSMRAASAHNLGKQVWPGGVPSGLTLPDLDTPGDCSLPATDARNLCGEVVSTEAWQAYIQRVRSSKQRLNVLPANVGVEGCTDYGSQFSSLGDYPRAITPGHQNPRDTPMRCAEFEEWSPPGVFHKFAAPDDDRNHQGLVLGWHAQMRDNDNADLAIDMLPLVPIPVPPYVFPLGQVLQLASVVVEVLLAAIFLPFICIYDYFKNPDADCIEASQKAADELDPVDLLKGLLPGKHFDTASKEVGCWHFINVTGARSNWYDDNQGLYYDEAGPKGVPGGVDQAIMLASDLMFLTLDASNSAGTERYEITADETSFPHPSSDRWDWEWQSEPFAHVPFSPIDNFALYGHQRFLKEHKTSDLGWVLHALGDVTVPMHVVGTTAWGHRPYEDAVGQSVEQLLFTECQATTSGAKPPEHCDNATEDILQLAQLQQAQRVLQRAFRWDRFLATHADPRDLVTSLAQETFQLHGINDDLYCDACSAGYLDENPTGFDEDLQLAAANWFTDEEDDAAYEDPEGYYTGKRSRFDKLRLNFERASAASLAYLMGTPTASVDCQEPALGTFCGGGGRGCCGESICTEPGQGSSSGHCCRRDETMCNADGECCSGVCGDDSQCCPIGWGRSGLGVSCSQDTDCCSALCQNGACAGPEDFPCTNDQQCASQSCENNKCTVIKGEIGAPCSDPSECFAEACINGQCGRENGSECTSDQQCSAGVCEGGECGRANGSNCTDAAQCRWDVCDLGVCGRRIGATCQFSYQCSTERCGGATCCVPALGDCTGPGDCCSGLCGSNGECGGPVK